MSRNLRHKRRATRCRELAGKVIRNKGWGVAPDNEADANHLVKSGNYSIRWESFHESYVIRARK